MSWKKKELFGAFAEAVRVSAENISAPDSLYSTREPPPKKLKDLAAKYVSIPPKHIKYFSKVPDAVGIATQTNGDKDKYPTATGTPKYEPRRP
ncbi:unnamed protein product [Phytophthora fragariaefolia]|uniref:Unnamed protein product n=1 Tax=Phytophthora fragariaefolia TaxID=1490495 RepID=A0A9W6YH27_9STRA|nr:unnamed protein product [Phytophthora fragariaefolia]